jgi:hypothetical protein
MLKYSRLKPGDNLENLGSPDQGRDLARPRRLPNARWFATDSLPFILRTYYCVQYRQSEVRCSRRIAAVDNEQLGLAGVVVCLPLLAVPYVELLSCSVLGALATLGSAF